MSKTFLAAVLREHRQPLSLLKLEVPRDLYVGQVLVKVAYSGLCRAQLGDIDAVKGESPYRPFCLGHEGGAIVVATGPGVFHVKPGDHVVMHWRKGKGIEAQPPKYWCPELNAEVGAGWVTSFQEYSVVSENRLTKIAKDVDLSHAALLGCAVTTGLGLVSNEICLKIGQSVLVYGCGGVGLNVIQGVRLAGGFATGVDVTQEKLDTACKFGASAAVFASHKFSGKYDVVVDTTGRPDVIKQAWENTSNEGVLCLVAQIPHDQCLQLQTLPMHGGKRIIGSDGGGTDPNRDIPRYLRLYDAGRLELAKLITHEFQLKDINDGLDLVRAGKVGRAIIKM